MLQPDDDLPDFVLTTVDNQAFTKDDLSDGWSLFFWFPKADTPGCTAQAIGLSDQKVAFDDIGCQVVGSSFDTPADMRAFRNSHGLQIILLSDERHEVAVAMGAADDITSTHPQRIAYLIDPTGVVRKTYKVDDPEFFAEEVLDDLEDLVP